MIGWTLLIFVALSALFALAVRKGVGVVGKALGKTVHDRHKSAESILEDGHVPSWWYREVLVSRLRPGASVDPKDPEFRTRARRRFLKRLDGLLKYFDTAPVFESEEARRMLVRDLRAARERWATAPWADIVQEEQPPPEG